MAMVDSIILGSGLSGLACALTLHRHGHTVRVIDPHDTVGGKVRTRHHASGFLIDQGFQVLLNSYPELSHFVDLKKLNLKNFSSGAMIYDGQKMNLLANPLVHPETFLDGFFNRLLTMSDKAQVLALLASSQLHRQDTPLGKQSTLQFLKDKKMSDHFIENFWRPFLTGVYLDPELSVGEDYFKFLIRCFSLGQVSLPEKGMGALPDLMAQELPSGCLQLSSYATSWNRDQVTLNTGETLKARQVVCAFDPKSHDDQRPYHAVTTHYYSSKQLSELNWGKWLILIPRHLGFQINHMALVTAVQPSYGLSGENLLSVSVVGQKDSDPFKLVQEIETFAQRKLDLTLVETTKIKKALPVIQQESELGYLVKDDIYYCGDYCTSPSINGALRSGRLAGEAIVSKLK